MTIITGIRRTLDWEKVEWEADVFFTARFEAVIEYASLAEEQQWPECDYVELPDQPGKGIFLGQVTIPFESGGSLVEICKQLITLSEPMFIEVADTNGEDFKS